MENRRAFDTAAYEIEAQLRELRRLLSEAVILSDAQEAMLEKLTAALAEIGASSASLRQALLTGDDSVMISPDDLPDKVEIEVVKAQFKSYHLQFETNLNDQFRNLEPFSLFGSPAQTEDVDSGSVSRLYRASDAFGRECLILDERENVARLDNPDDRARFDKLKDRLITVHEFDTVAAFESFVSTQGEALEKTRREFLERPDRDDDEDFGSAGAPARVKGPSPTLRGGAARKLEEAA